MVPTPWVLNSNSGAGTKIHPQCSPSKGDYAIEAFWFWGVDWAELGEAVSSARETQNLASLQLNEINISLPAIIRCFLSYHHIMRMAFGHTGGGDADELGFVLEGGDVFGAAVAHAGAEAAYELPDDFGEGAFVGTTGITAPVDGNIFMSQNIKSI